MYFVFKTNVSIHEKHKAKQNKNTHMAFIGRPKNKTDFF